MNWPVVSCVPVNTLPSEPITMEFMKMDEIHEIHEYFMKSSRIRNVTSQKCHESEKWQKWQRVWNPASFKDQDQRFASPQTEMSKNHRRPRHHKHQPRHKSSKTTTPVLKTTDPEIHFSTTICSLIPTALRMFSAKTSQSLLSDKTGSSKTSLFDHKPTFTTTVINPYKTTFKTTNPGVKTTEIHENSSKSGQNCVKTPLSAF